MSKSVHEIHATLSKEILGEERPQLDNRDPLLAL